MKSYLFVNPKEVATADTVTIKKSLNLKKHFSMLHGYTYYNCYFAIYCVIANVALGYKYA